MLRTQYRQPLDWTLVGLDEAHKTLWEWYGDLEGKEPATGIPGPVLDALTDDLNTPKAITEMHRLHSAGHWGGLRAALGFLGFSGERRRSSESGASRWQQRPRSRCEALMSGSRAQRRAGGEEFQGGGPHPRRARSHGHHPEGRQGPQDRRAHHHLGGRPMKPLLGDLPFKNSRASISRSSSPCSRSACCWRCISCGAWCRGRHDPRTHLALRHDAPRRRADPWRRLLGRGQMADRAAARRARHRLYRGRLSRREPDRYAAVRRGETARSRQAHRVRHDQAARPLDRQRSGLPGAARRQRRFDLPGRQDVGLPRRCGARHQPR